MKETILEKGVIVNLLGLLLILIGYFAPDFPFQGVVLSAGLFAFSGSLTNWIAVQMIFEKIPFLYGSGVVVTRFESFKEGIRQMIMENFFTEQNFEKLKNRAGGLSLDVEKLEGKINLDAIFDELKHSILESSVGGVLNMFGGESVLEQFRDEFKKRMLGKLPKLLSELNLEQMMTDALGYDQLKDRIEGMIQEKLNELTAKDVKRIVEKMIKKHLGWLVVWGGVFGGLMGVLAYFLR